jgi:AcrR family transcriptional regulator
MGRWAVEPGLLPDALVSVVSSVGWDRATVAAVCRAAHLSTGVFYPRYSSLEGAGLAVWEDRLRASLVGALAELAVVPELGRRGDFVVGMTDMASGRPELLAAVELVLASRFSPGLGMIWQEFRTLLDDLVSGQPVERAAARIFVVIEALGLLLSSRREWAGACDLGPVLTRHFEALLHPGPPLDLPDDRAEYMHLPPVQSGDPRIDALFVAALDEVAARGFQGAHLTDICRHAGVTTGFLYSRWSGKQEFFLHAIEHSWGAGFGSSVATTAELSDAYGPAAAEAVMWREMTNPVLRTKMVLVLEMNRLATFEPQAAAVLADQEAGFVATAAGDRAELGAVRMEIAQGLGLPLVGSALDGTDQIAFSAVLRRLGPVPA